MSPSNRRMSAEPEAEPSDSPQSTPPGTAVAELPHPTVDRQHTALTIQRKYLTS